MNVLLPALGIPRRPTSASTLSSRRRLRFSPSSPGVNWRGARLVLDLKCILPSPPLPPRATSRPLPVDGQVGQALAGVGVGDHRADRDAQHDVLGALAVLIGAAAVLAAPRAVNARVAVIDQRVDVAVGDEQDAAAPAAVTAVGSAARDEFFAAERGRAVAAVAGDDLDARFVDELHDVFRKRTKRSVSSPRRAPCQAISQPRRSIGSPSWRPY